MKIVCLSEKERNVGPKRNNDQYAPKPEKAEAIAIIERANEIFP